MDQPPYEKSVFINCPFDPDFEPLFHAIVFTVAAFGFVPRSARETEGRAETRIVRIVQALSNSKYSIHDLSRFTGEGTDNLARFNMPLELGVALALQSERQGTIRSHNWLVLFGGGYEYQRFVSDLAGFDPSRHELTVQSVIREVASWLQVQEDVLHPAPSASAVLAAHEQFEADLVRRRREALNKAIWPDVLRAASANVPRF